MVALQLVRAAAARMPVLAVQEAVAEDDDRAVVVAVQRNPDLAAVARRR